MKKRLIALLCAFALVIPSLAFAAGKDKNDVIYGVALDDKKQEQMNDVFGIKAGDANTNFSSVNGKDLEKYLGYEAPDGNMISSVYIKYLPDNSGIKVNISTPANITQITNGQYTNAAITAGITDADIFVASPTPVTGESALVGVYKALEEKGQEIDPQRAKVAQEELETVTEIAKENKDKIDFDPKELDKLVIEVKQKLASHKEETGQSASTEQIGIYINDALKNLNLENILSDNNINILINYFDKYQDSSAIDSKEVKENLIKFGNELANNANEFYKNNKDSIDDVVNQAQESGLLDSILDFFRSIVNSIANLFSSNN
ncbi:DUF1002 domain-containing protein [Anaerococcus urinomassiliensis]|uniref:DUF1002 domain-containing protein n=1 Tax=Anaerococcus urinomassiliensis TaxID=1745712 RepID=UPI00093BD372|nr:DUF1002 domain-containing protein [Anaerococcus urinomassiliensis]